jgi:hypothetical protein
VWTLNLGVFITPGFLFLFLWLGGIPPAIKNLLAMEPLWSQGSGESSCAVKVCMDLDSWRGLIESSQHLVMETGKSQGQQRFLLALRPYIKDQRNPSWPQDHTSRPRGIWILLGLQIIHQHQGESPLASSRNCLSLHTYIEVRLGCIAQRLRC